MPPGRPGGRSGIGSWGREQKRARFLSHLRHETRRASGETGRRQRSLAVWAGSRKGRVFCRTCDTKRAPAALGKRGKQTDTQAVEGLTFLLQRQREGSFAGTNAQQRVWLAGDVFEQGFG